MNVAAPKLRVAEEELSLIYTCNQSQDPGVGALLELCSGLQTSSDLFLQTIGRDSETSEKESAYWTDRYKVRMRQTSPAGVFANAVPKPDIPAFLESCTDSILTTGTCLLILW